jgi:SAM-dependent methyltransferase
VFPKSVRWASHAFGRKHRNFSFERLNIFNHHYNPSGTERDTTVQLPYPDGSFDFVLLTSIFTHMYLPGISHYLSEIHRLLKPGGKCFSTFFLLDGEARRLIGEGKSHVKFRYTDPHEGWMALEKEDPERCIAFPLEHIMPLFAAKHLVAEPEPRLGYWSTRQPSFSFQDVIISEKR